MYCIKWLSLSWFNCTLFEIFLCGFHRSPNFTSMRTCCVVSTWVFMWRRCLEYINHVVAITSWVQFYLSPRNSPAILFLGDLASLRHRNEPVREICTDLWAHNTGIKLQKIPAIRLKITNDGTWNECQVRCPIPWDSHSNPIPMGTPAKSPNPAHVFVPGLDILLNYCRQCSASFKLWDKMPRNISFLCILNFSRDFVNIIVFHSNLHFISAGATKLSALRTWNTSRFSP